MLKDLLEAVASIVVFSFGILALLVVMISMIKINGGDNLDDEDDNS